MILADENIHGFIINALREAGISVISVQESKRGIKDEQVIQLAQKNDQLLLTEDKDFGEWVFAHHVQNLSVILLRYSFNEFTQIAGVLVNLLKTQELERPFFATITTSRLRIRKL